MTMKYGEMKFQRNTWLIEEDYEQFQRVVPKEWIIVEIERWYHSGDRKLTGTKLAISFDIYAETENEVISFWRWFNVYLDGSPDININDREIKWAHLMEEAAA